MTDMKNTPKNQVLLFYKYVHINDPKSVVKQQKRLCERLGITGRIIVASEGINGTLEGTTLSTESYIKQMQEDERFASIFYKKSPGEGGTFPRLSVKVRPEIVSAYLPDLDPTVTSGKHLPVEMLHQWYEEGREFYVVDMRNDFEYASGQFEGSVLSGFKHLRDLPEILEKIDHLKDKTIVTVCTGGVKCEKASGFLVEHGFTDVYQLDGGIQTYIEKFPNAYFKGKLYVYDGRVTIAFNADSPDHEVIGTCEGCGVKTDTYVNCSNDPCHRHYISCDTCKDEELDVFLCSPECADQYREATAVQQAVA